MGEVPTLPFFPKERAEQKKYLGFRERLEEQVEHWLHSHEEVSSNILIPSIIENARSLSSG
ncbi:hypothetical protein WN944_026066 [Citrus x changshan-huyou]|uniref:Uncharacterized protein n=1 Tax=Citrus x changshan-huyou TaxID=2935761 RepID=A0AAP0LQZ3_9ROSI